MTRKFCLIILSVFVLAENLPAQAEILPRFFETLYDVPIMDGLEELPDHSFIFDKPEGRIVQSAAAGQQPSVADIEHFYTASLPELGWSPIRKNTYQRKNEVLSIRIESSNRLKIVHFTLSPL